VRRPRPSIEEKTSRAQREVIGYCAAKERGGNEGNWKDAARFAPSGGVRGEGRVCERKKLGERRAGGWEVTLEVVERCRREEVSVIGRARRGPRADIDDGRIMVRFEGMSARCTTVQRGCTALRRARAFRRDIKEMQRCKVM
jgi:hypothetical protein